jgi:hypothetical protein
MGFAGGNGGFQGRAVHPSHHDDAAGGLFLDDCRNQPFTVELKFVVKAHRMNCFRFGRVRRIKTAPYFGQVRPSDSSM